MKAFTWLSVALLMAVSIGGENVQAVVIINDDFESYIGTAEMDLVWNDGIIGNGTLDPFFGNPGQSLFHPGGFTQRRSFNPTVATDSEPLVWEFDLYDDGLPGKRNTGSLRDNGAGAPLTALLEMGRYNFVFDPESRRQVEAYALRTAFVGGPDWLTFTGNPAIQPGWHTFRAIIGSSNIVWELDLMADGFVDGARTTPLDGNARAFNVARFGGPSDLSSPGGAVSFDNLTLSKAAPIVYQGVLTHGVTQFDSVSSSGTFSDPDSARYWRFSGNQGDVVRIDGLRQEFDLDPAMWVFEGVFDNTSSFVGGAAAGFDPFDSGFLNIADDDLQHPGPYGDPRSMITLTLPGAGQYTVAITNYASGPNDGGDGRFDYSITLLSVPEPAALSLVGVPVAVAMLCRRPHRFVLCSSHISDLLRVV